METEEIEAELSLYTFKWHLNPLLNRILLRFKGWELETQGKVELLPHYSDIVLSKLKKDYIVALTSGRGFLVIEKSKDLRRLKMLKFLRFEDAEKKIIAWR